MIETIGILLEIDKFYGKSERIEIAKGKYQLTNNLRKAWEQKKRERYGSN